MPREPARPSPLSGCVGSLVGARLPRIRTLRWEEEVSQAEPLPSAQRPRQERWGARAAPCLARVMLCVEENSIGTIRKNYRLSFIPWMFGFRAVKDK